MDKPGSKEAVNPDTSPSSPTENCSEDIEVESESPERSHTSDTETINLSISSRDPKHLGTKDIALDDGENPQNESNVPEDYVTFEQMVQRQVLLASALETRDSNSVYHCKYPSCDFFSSDAELFLKHEDTHIDTGTFCCDICSARFTSYAIMRRHRLAHLDVRSFECQQCPKRFLNKDQLTEHIARHSRQRPYRCPFCSRTFTFRPHLKMHLSSDHAGIVLEKACRLCDFKASSPNGAKIHFAMCHLKQGAEAESEAVKAHGIYNGASQIHIVPRENGAIDLATVSQNFSFMPGPYAQFPITANDAAGPSDLSHTASKSLHNQALATSHIVPHVSVDRNPHVQDLAEDDRHSSITALAGSTTVVSPTSCQDRPCCRVETRHQPDPMPHGEVHIKPEPPELIVDDSQNSNVQPTSTMDLTVTDVVETTCIANEVSVPCSSVPMRRKAHKHSSGDETSSESYQSPTNRNFMDPHEHHGPSAHSCCRLRHCEESSGQRCRAYSRHTCDMHRVEKRARLSEPDACRNMPNNHPGWIERKVFYNRATSTDSAMEAVSRSARRMPPHRSDNAPCTSEAQNHASYFDNKSSIAIRSVESCTLTCPYCEIIFPDSTLYLLHRSLHSDVTPWKCNLCGKSCKDKYDFNSHIISKGHY